MSFLDALRSSVAVANPPSTQPQPKGEAGVTSLPSLSEDEVMASTETHNVTGSNISARVRVSLPRSYHATDSGRVSERYPVLYLLEADLKAIFPLVATAARKAHQSQSTLRTCGTPTPYSHAALVA